MNAEISFDDLQKFWAKTTHDPEQFPRAFHPLLCHMMDVGTVTLALWNHVLPSATKRRIAHCSELSMQDTGTLIAWIAALHDLGKASPPFAHRPTTQNIHQLYDGTRFEKKIEPLPAKSAPHGYVTASELPEILQSEEFGFSPAFAEQIGILIGGHHGVFPRAENLNPIQEYVEYQEGKKWKRARHLLTVEMTKIFPIRLPILSNSPGKLDNASTMVLAGLVSVADWIGSNAEFFPCYVSDQTQPFTLDVVAYKTKSEQQAIHALTALGWMNWAEPDRPRAFTELFADIKTPHPLQQAAMELAPLLTSPGLVVVEAPMGEGKTETAMFLADHWNATLEQRGIYFALPTQATSNQMFGRVQKFLRQRYSESQTVIQLLHGHAALSGEFQTLLKDGKQAVEAQLQSIYCDECNAACTPRVVAAEWFTHRKRGLLAPFGVGTIDQSLLSILKTRHVFVRLFGLANKTVIIDEVHAYDAYMSVLLERLLEWLAALGSPVILLSATLPLQRRNALVQAYQKGLGIMIEQTAQVTANYPRLSWATAAKADSFHIQTSPQNTRTLFLRHLDQDITQLGETLQAALQHGGCAAVICNTVGRAQEVYESLQPFFPALADDGQPELDLLHARFLFKDRAEREFRALLRFGKKDGVVTDRNNQPHTVKRPHRAVLVATQIIEQSLDLDFDLMISEHAPVDLLLQRSGRLHRHQRENRPANLTQPTIWIAANDPADKLNFGVSAFVYDEHILLRSHLALCNKTQIAIPDEVSELIEFVYDDRACPDEAMSEAWTATANKLQKKRSEKESKARPHLILTPHAQDFFNDYNPQLEEDNPEFHKTLQASTRDDDTPSLQVVVLRHDERHRIPANHLHEARWLLEHSVNLSNRQVVFHLIAQGAAKEWAENSLLRHHRLLVLDENNQCVLGKAQLRLDDNLGIVITKTEEEPECQLSI
jgi:CRISPR-associated endonuclease/helicase Cas3